MALWWLVLLLCFNALTASTSSVRTRLSTSEDQVQTLQTRLSTSEDQVQTLQNRLGTTEFILQMLRTDSEAAVESRLTASEDNIKGMQKEMIRTRDRLTSLITTVVQPLVERLDTSNNHVQELNGKIAEMTANLTASQNQVEVLQTRLSTSESNQQRLKSESKDQLSRVETMVNQLSRKITDQPQVAFSAYNLHDGGYIGPYSSPTTLVYKKVFTNIGNAYSTSTGYFRAPFRGVYYFRFTAATYGSSERMQIIMYKNNQKLIYNYGQNNHDGYEYMSNAVIVQMEQGDTVDMRLWGGSGSSFRLYDSSNNHNTFSGFLLYAL